MRRSFRVVIVSLLILAASAAGPCRSTAQQADEYLAYAYSSTVGTTSRPWLRSNAYLNQPWGVGADVVGVWIANSAGRNVLRFDTGPVVELGRAGDIYDLYEGPSRWPADVAVSGIPGNDDYAVWTVDSGAHVALKFRFQYDGSPRAPSVTGIPEAPGDDAEHFDSPTGIAADRAGFVYVSDTGNHRVQVLDSDGVHVSTIGRTGEPGQANDQFNSPARLVASSDAVLYVADSGNHRIQAFDVAEPSTPTYLRTYGRTGVAGSGDGEFDTPLGVAVDATFLYVADAGNARVQILERTDAELFKTLDGTRGKCGISYGETWDYVSDVGVAGDGTIYVALPTWMQVYECDPFNRALRGVYGTRDEPYPAAALLHNAPSGLAPADDGTVVVVEMEGHRVVKRPEEGDADWSFGSPGQAGSGDDELDTPVDVVELADGRYVVSDSGNSRLVVLTPEGKLSETWGAAVLDTPLGISATSGGGLAVADSGLGEVRLFDGAGKDLGALADQTGRPLGFASPWDAASDSAGNWYVSDAARNTVYVYDSSGALTGILGEEGVSGRDFDHFDRPRGLGVDEHGRLHVADSANHRVQVFAADGTLATTIGGLRGSGTGGLAEPHGISIAADGRLYVADTYNHRLQVYRPAVEPWVPAAVNGLGDVGTVGITSLVQFGGGLFAGTASPVGAGVYRRGSDGAWDLAAPAGFAGRGHDTVSTLREIGGRLYAGITHLHIDIDPTSGSKAFDSDGGSLWRSPNGIDWDKVADGGFGDRENSGIVAIADFEDHVYAGTRRLNSSEGAQLWRSATGDTGSWERVRIDLFTRTEWDSNVAISALATYSDTLVVGTCAQVDGPQLWSSDDGDVWRPIGYTADPSDPRAAVPQIGSDGTVCTTSLLEHEGYLYAGLGSELSGFGDELSGDGPAEVWRCHKCDGTDWLPVTAPGLGSERNRGRVALATYIEHPFSYLYLAVGNGSSGVEVWRSIDGLDWEQVALGGFGDSANTDLGGGGAVAEHGGRLYFGTWNLAHGGEIWSTGGSRPGTIPTPPGPTVTPTPRASPQPPTGRARYEKVDEWPSAPVAPGDVIGSAIDMAIADDTTVFIVDRSPARLLRLLPDGTWAEGIGGVGSGPDRLTRPAAVAVDQAAGLVYVSDLGTDRIVAYTLDGTYQRSFMHVHARDLEVRDDGTIWVADVLSGGVRRLAPDGSEVERFGIFGPSDEDGFLGLVAVTEDPGGTLWIADQNGMRVRGFVRDGGGWKRTRTINMRLAGQQRGGGEAACSGRRLQALSEGVLLAGACIVDDGQVKDRLPLQHRGSDLYDVDLRTVNIGKGLYYAMAEYDVDRDDLYNEVFPAVVRYLDEGFDIVTGTWLARKFSASSADPNAVGQPVRITSLSDGSVVLSDAFGLRRFSPDGIVVEKLPTRTKPSRSARLTLYPRLVVSTGEPGKVAGVANLVYGRRFFEANLDLLVYGRGVRQRVCEGGHCERDIFLEAIWDTTLVNNKLARGANDYNYAATYEESKKQYVLLQLYADNPSDLAFPSRVRFYPIEDRGRKAEVLLEGTDREVLWTDIDAGPDGRVYVLDTLGDKVQVLDADGSKLGLVDTVKDAWKVAGGPNGEIFVLTTYGHVVRMAADGTVLSRFNGLPNEYAAYTGLQDLTVDAWGRVFTIDSVYNLVMVFEPDGTEEDELQGGTCNLSGDKWVAPEHILLGDTAEVFLRLDGTCGFLEEPADIVLVVCGDSARNGNLRVARQILSLIDLDTHRAGLVSFGADAFPEEPLTHDSDRLIRALASVPLRRVTSCGCNHLAAIKAAGQMLYDGAPRQKMMILIPPGTEHAQGSCIPTALQVADEARRHKLSGVVIVAVNGESIAVSSELLSSVGVAERGQGVGRPALRRSVERRWPENLLDGGILTDTLPVNIEYVTGSARPPAIWDSVTRSLTWHLTGLDLQQVHDFRLTIKPREEGLWPTNVRAEAQGTDGWGNLVRKVLPVPEIRVYGEMPTPTRTLTATPTSTPEPTRTPGPLQPIYLPIALHVEGCKPDSRNADVALVIDTSGSMSASTTAGGPTKLEAARQAAKDFAGNLVAGRDQAAVIQFNIEATVLVPLTADIAAVQAGLDQLTQEAGTRIDLAIEEAHRQLTGPSRRETNNPVIVLLTDGEPTHTSPDAVRDAAQRAKTDQLLVFTVGLGTDVDEQLLEDIASRPEWYFPAPDTSDLQAIYEQIAYEIPCEPLWP